MIETYNKQVTEGTFKGIERDETIRGGVNQQLVDAIKLYKKTHTFKEAKALMCCRTVKG